MSTCKTCGAEMADDAKVCDSCGSTVEEVADKKEEVADKKEEVADKKDDAAKSTTDEVADKISGVADKASKAFDELNDTPDTTADFDPEDIANNKAMSVLAYLGILVFIPLFKAKDSKFARFHTNQGLAFFILCVVLAIIQNMVSEIAIVGGLVKIAVCIVVLFLLSVGIANVINGKAKELPIIGKVRILNDK